MQASVQCQPGAPRGLLTWTVAGFKMRGSSESFWNKFVPKCPPPLGQRVGPFSSVFPRIELTEKERMTLSVRGSLGLLIEESVGFRVAVEGLAQTFLSLSLERGG